MIPEIKIRQISNGFIISYVEEVEVNLGTVFDGNRFRTYEEAVEWNECGCDDDIREALARALNSIIDYFGLAYEKHGSDKKFIKVQMVAHEKYFDDEDAV